MNRRPSGYEPDELPLLHSAMFSGGQGWIRTTVPFGTDLQSAAFNHSATYPFSSIYYIQKAKKINPFFNGSLLK